MAHDREVAGIRCSQVLEHLSDYIDGEVTQADRRRIEDHLRGCDWCETFGGRFGATVRELRMQLGPPDPVDDDVARRLANKLNLDIERE